MNHLAKETLNFIIGILIIMISSPMVIVIAILSVTWDFVDRLIVGRPFQKPVTGLTSILGSKLTKFLEPFSLKVVAFKEDVFFITYYLFYAIFIPVFFFSALKYTNSYGFSWELCLAYNVIRIGPYFINFAYIYTMCHKEGHQGTDLYKPNFKFLNGIFNYWIGLFYGVLPATFLHGHSKNHHKYNNNEGDLVTTGDRARDNIFNFVKFVPRFTLYSLNISTTIQFYKEGEKKIALHLVLASLYYFVFFALIFSLNPQFAIFYVLYPLLEQNLFLSTTNWTWHAFLHEDDPDEIFGNSITIHDGAYNVLNEDYHVVHHQYPGAHWTNYPKLYQKHIDQYKNRKSFMIKDLHQFSVFALIVLRQYGWLADKIVGDEGFFKNRDEKIEFVKNRLRICSWGPNANYKKNDYAYKNNNSKIKVN